MTISFDSEQHELSTIFLKVCEDNVDIEIYKDGRIEFSFADYHKWCCPSPEDLEDLAQIAREHKEYHED